MSTHVKFALTFCLCSLLLALPAWPQSSSATISGTVRDQTSAVIPGAEVTLTNTATNLVLKTQANSVGFYMFTGVIPGPYNLVVVSPGMQRFEGTLAVQVAQRAVVDATLAVGQTATEVSVRDLTPMVTVDNPTLGHTLERERIEQLPINGRTVTSLLQTVPGMEGNLRAYGQKVGATEMVLDGAAMNDRLWGYGVVRRQPGLDTIQEFKVENNNSSAKFTRPTTIILSTKSGSNEFHGTLFETNRNNAYGLARSRTDTYTNPPMLIRNEFGGTAGGPVWLPKIYDGRNRTFWFFSYEGYRYRGRSSWNGSVPTAEMRAGDFRGYTDSRGVAPDIYNPWTTDPVTWKRDQFAYRGVPNTIDPALLSPLGKYLLDITPMPTHPDVNPRLDSNWWGNAPRRINQWTVTTRVDHRVTDNDRVYFRYTQGDTREWSQEWHMPFLDGVSGSVTRLAPNKSAAISYVRTFSPTLFNEFLGSVTRENWWKGTGEPGVKYADQLGLPNPLNVAGFPTISGGGLDMYWDSDNAQGSPYTYAIIDDNVTKIAGQHELQFGFHHRYDQLNTLPDQQQPQGSHTFNTLPTSLYDPVASTPTNPRALPQTGNPVAALYLGNMTYSNQFVRGYFYLRAREYSLYFQDNYKVTPRLTLNLGVRWEYWPAYKEKNNFLTGFSMDQRAVVLGNTLDEMYRMGATTPSIVNRYEELGAKFITTQEAGLPDAFTHSNPRNFGPRLGFAYRAGDGGRPFILRGGYRISYFPLPIRGWSVIMRSNAPTTARFRNNPNDSALSPDGLPNYMLRSMPEIIAGKNSQNAVNYEKVLGITRGSAGGTFFDPHQPDSRTHDWNFTIEKELIENTVAKVSYVGNHGGYLDQTRAYNSAVPEYVWYMTTGEPLPVGEYSGVARRNWDQTVYGGISEYGRTGYSNFSGLQMELERRYTRGYGFQLFYVISNVLTNTGMAESPGGVSEANQFMPGAVPEDFEERNKFLNYRRDTGIPKHRVRWNWIVDLPFGKGKPLGRNAGSFLDRVIGGWQIAGMGSLNTRYFSLPTGLWQNFGNLELYGYKYPIENCTSGTCYPGYLWYNGYIPADKINSHDPVTGKPNGIMGVPENYKPVAEPLLPWPKNPSQSDPMYNFYGTNTVWIPLENGAVQRTTYAPNLHPWRNQYAPGTRTWGLDASLFKRVAITESVSLRFNADFFNVLNHPGNPNSIGENGVLSTRNSDLSPRQIQLTLRLSW